MPETTTTDGRHLRGARSRRLVLDRAVDVGSSRGLDGLSFGGLANDVGMSKAGVQVLFGTKEALQVEVAEHARSRFIEAVIEPTRSAAPGLTRLRALLDRWVVYAETPLFAGGCFRSANLPVFDSVAGPVRDTLTRHQAEWIGVVARELRHAVQEGEIAELDVELTAFEIDAVLCATNTSIRLGDENAVPRMRAIIDGLLS